MEIIAQDSPVEIEGDSIRFDVGFEDVLELLECYGSRAVTVDIVVKPGPGRKQSGEELHVHVEILEGNEVIRVGPLQ